MSNGILLNNAYEAWMNATQYGWALRNGVTSLGYKKSFVSALHNSVELFVKQLMLDANDYRVATVKKMKLQNGEPMRSFLNATDLNTYFSSITKEERKQFYTIEFNELINICCKVMDIYPDSPRPALELLQRLRNDETHFYVDKNDYLSDSEFEMLYNFMVDFYDLINVQKNLFPENFEKLPFGAAEISFSEDKLTNFTFLGSLKSSDMAVWVKEAFGAQEKLVSCPIDNGYVFAYEAWDDIREKAFSFDWAFPFLVSIYENNLIEFERISGESTNSVGGESYKAIIKY